MTAAAQPCLPNPLHPARMKNMLPRRLASANGGDVLGTRAVAALAAHSHLVAGRCLPLPIVARRMAAEALGDLFLRQFSA